MKNNDYKRVMQYIATMNIIESWLKADLISKSDYDKIDTIMAEKYGISSCSIYRRNNLI